MHVALCSLPVCAGQDDNSEVDEQEDEEEYHVGSKRADEEHESDDSKEQEEVGYFSQLARSSKTFSAASRLTETGLEAGNARCFLSSSRRSSSECSFGVVERGEGHAKRKPEGSYCQHVSA